jgi:hypothetical protein
VKSVQQPAIIRHLEVPHFHQWGISVKLNLGSIDRARNGFKHLIMAGFVKVIISKFHRRDVAIALSSTALPNLSPTFGI